MDQNLADLAPLFVGEARGRLERLASLVPRMETEPAVSAEVRRELHTLKGAGRMLRMPAFAELCHAAESALQPPRPGVVGLLTRVLDRLAAMVDTVAGGEMPTPDAELLAALGGAPAPERPSTASQIPAIQLPAASSEIRLEVATVDTLADRATRQRILALGTERHIFRIAELARLAEQGVHEHGPQQVLAVLATSLRRLAVELEGGQKQLLRTAETQLESLLALQIQPLRGILQNVARHARDLAGNLGKEVDIQLIGEDTRLDRRIARELEDALLHLVRNAIDHGIERPDAREKARKPRRGKIRLEASTAGDRVRLSISDDGAGIEPAKVVEAAIARGMIDAEEARTLTHEQALRLLFTPGLSTRTKVTELSGRGVGLDVVLSAATRVGGEATIEVLPGRGTTVTVQVPVARRGEQVMIVRVGSLRLGMPATVIRRVSVLTTTDRFARGGRSFALLKGKTVQFVQLAHLFGEEPAERQYLLQGDVSGQAIRIAVDGVEANEEVLVRPLGRATAPHSLLDGIALLASGQPVAVLSPMALAQVELRPSAPVVMARPTARRMRVLLIDDSMVTREMERRLLEDAGFEVVPAGDATEALAHLGEQTFDCLVTDIEMPGMDGYEFTRHIRTMPHLQQVPVVVVSTRDHPEDRLRGLEAGADAYLTKQGLDATELTSVVRRLAGR